MILIPDKVTEDTDDLLSTSMHVGGIKALLEKANKGQDFRFPPEVRAYITSHFQMIRSENKKLNQSMDNLKSDIQQYQAVEKEFKSQKREVIQLQDQLKAIQSQLDREKAKNKAMMKKIKLEAANNFNNNNNTNNNDDVIWFSNNLPNHVKNHEKDLNLVASSRPATAASNRPSTAASNTAFSCSHVADERKVKLLNKTVKLKNEISKLQKENQKMKEVHFSYNFSKIQNHSYSNIFRENGYRESSF